MPNIKAIIFDFDGVIADSEHLYAQADFNILNQIGISLSKHQIHAKFAGMHFDDMHAILANDYGSQKTNAYINNIKAETDRLMQTSLMPIQHVKHAISTLNLPYYIGSNSIKANIENRLKLLNMHHLFTHNIIGCDCVKYPKPATDMFEMAAEKMKISPDNIAVIEDSIYGIKAAKQLGMKALGFTGQSTKTPHHADKLAQAGADLTFDDMRQLNTFLKAL